MKEFLRFLRIWRDDNGQAMTEFVIIIPVVVFMFALVLQTVFVAQVSQMMNYAGFIAARSYATSFSYEKAAAGGNANQGHQRAFEKAKFSANLVMAPVSGAVTGEGLGVWNSLRSSRSRNRITVQETLYRVGEGVVISAFYRMKNFRLPRPAESDTSVVTCTFEYMCPIDVPGVAELWNYLFHRDQQQGNNLGDALIESQFIVNRNNLVEGSMTGGQLNTLINDTEDALDQFADRQGLSSFNGGLTRFRNKPYNSTDFLGAPLNIRLFAKSAVGFEPWSGSLTFPANTESPFTDPDVQKCVDDMNALKKAVADQGLITTNVCNDAVAKSNAWVTAKNELQACRARQATNANINCSAEVTKEFTSFNAFKAREADCEDEGDELGDRNDELANYKCASAQPKP